MLTSSVPQLLAGNQRECRNQETKHRQLQNTASGVWHTTQHVPTAQVTGDQREDYQKIHKCWPQPAKIKTPGDTTDYPQTIMGPPLRPCAALLYGSMQDNSPAMYQPRSRQTRLKANQANGKHQKSQAP
jgi:hypothetical protein